MAPDRGAGVGAASRWTMAQVRLRPEAEPALLPPLEWRAADRQLETRKRLVPSPGQLELAARAWWRHRSAPGPRL